MTIVDPGKSRLRRLIESPPWTRRPEQPGLEVDDDTRRLLGNMTAVGLQAVQMLASVATAALGRTPWQALLFTVTICGLLLFRLRRLPFQRIPPPTTDKPGDAEYWRSTRRLFLAAQVVFFVLGVVILALVSGHAGRPAAELALRLVLYAGLAGLFASAYRVQ